MGINTLEFNTKLTAELDKAVVEKSKTGFFADNAFASKFVGAKTVLLPDLTLDGAADYDRDADAGFKRGSMTLAQTPYTLEMERARSFQIDRLDADETGVANLAGQISAEFVRTRIIPEMDAHNLAKLAQTAVEEDQLVTAVASTLTDKSFSILDEALRNAQEGNGGEDEDMVAFVDPVFWAALCNSSLFQKYITVSDFTKGSITTRVKSYNGCAIIPVPGARMKSEFVFYDGATSGQEAGGFAPATNAKGVHLIVLPKHNAHLVKKTEQTRIFTPKQNQDADAWKIDYRIFYDIFVKKSRKPSIWAALAE